MVNPLSDFPPEERERRLEIIRKLTDPDYVLADFLKTRLATDDPVRDGFAPRGSDLRDFSVIRGHDGRYHVFFIDVMHGKSSRAPDNYTFLAHASTPDFTRWQVHKPALYVAPGTWEGGHISAPYVFRPHTQTALTRERYGVAAEYVMIYTGISLTVTQSLGMAMSEDLLHWTRYDGNPILQPAHFGWALWRRDRLANCRDPHVLQLNGWYALYYTALQADGDPCVAAAESENLENWRDLGPVLALPFVEVSPAMIESACVHPKGDRYVMFYTRAGGTWYSVSDDPLHFEYGGDDSRLIEDHWGLEVIERKDEEWLVALFRRQTEARGGALFLGRLRWDGLRARVELIRDKAELARFL